MIFQRIEKITHLGEDRFESKLRSKDGVIVDVEVSIKYQASQDVMVVFVHDITDRKRVEEKLRKSEEQNKAIVTSTPDHIIVNDRALRYTLVVNPELGLSEEAMLGKTDYDILSKEEADQLTKVKTEVLETGKSLKFETSLISASGKEEFFEGSFIPLFDANPEPVGLIGYFRNVTERRRAEMALIQSEERYRSLVGNLEAGVVVHAPDTSIINSNEQASKLLGLSKDQLQGKTAIDPVWKFVNDALTPLPFDEYPVYRILLTGEPIKNQILGVIQPGKSDVVWLTVNGFPIQNNNGEITEIVISFIDITEQKQTEIALIKAKKQTEESVERFNLAMKASNDGLFDWNLITNEIYYSPSWKKMLGYEDHELPNDFSVWENTTNPEDVQKSWELQQKLITRQIDRFVLEFKMKHKDGHWVDVLSRAEAIFNNEGNAIRIVGTHTDISARKQGEEKLIKSEERYALVLDASEQGIWDWNVETNEAFYSEQWKRQIGYEDHELKNVFDTWVEYLHPEEKEHCVNVLLSYLNNPDAHYIQNFRFRHKNGTYRWIHSKAASLKNAEGKVIRMFGTHTDITDRKQAEETLIKLNTAIEKSEVSVVITNNDGNIEYANPYFSKLTGYSEAEYIGKNPKVLKSDYHPKEFYQNLWDTIKSGKTWEGEIYNRKKNGEYYWENAIISPIEDNKHEITHFVAIKTDITGAKEINSELITAKEHAEESDRLKSAFLANMSHEIRTPLNSIIGFSELLTDSDFNDHEKEAFIASIISKGNQLPEIISEYIDITKIKTKQLFNTKRAFKGHELITEIYNDFKFKVLDKNIDFRICTSGNEPEVLIYSDKPKLKQVLINFVGNSLKFTSAGFIEIGMKAMESEIEFFVIDTGIGIHPSKHEYVFKRFYQLEDSQTRKYGGNGLGLTISKSIIELLDGRIGLESEPGKGSKFFFTIPRD